MKDIVVIANFSQVPGENGNDRFAYLANSIKHDCNVELITSSFHHKRKTQREKQCETTDNRFVTTTVYEPGYSKNICMKRFYSHWIWGRNVKKYLKNRKKPDVVYCAVPSLTAPYEAAKYCEKNGIKFIIDIQDLWPEAFKMVFNVPVLSNMMFAPFKHRVNQIYKMADVICAVSEHYAERALSVNSKCMAGHAVFLGTSLEKFDNNVNMADAPIKKSEEDGLWLGYCGSLAASYDIPCVIDALKILKDKGYNVPKFVVMGDGARRTEFEETAKNAGVGAVFLGVVPYDQMCAQIVQCDIVVNPIVKGSAASIINKHGDYAASGLPVINNQDSVEYRSLIEKYNMGLNCKNGDPVDMAEKLVMLIQDQKLRVEMGKNARRCAEEKFDRQNSYGELIKSIIE